MVEHYRIINQVQHVQRKLNKAMRDNPNMVERYQEQLDTLRVRLERAIPPRRLQYNDKW